MMRQYDEAKQACGDALLLFRMGDFYELFHEDAKAAARALGLTLTAREKGVDAIPMAGFPHHQLDSYLAKLIHQGFRVAVCEQVEDAKQAKGLVKREVTQIVTPGTVTDETLLDPRQNNFLAAVTLPIGKSNETRSGVSWLEVSTGEFWTAELETIESLRDLLAQIKPSEIILDESEYQRFREGDTPLSQLLANRDSAITDVPSWCFNYKNGLEKLHQHFQVAHLAGFGVDEGNMLAIAAAGAITQYLFDTQQKALQHIDSLRQFRGGSWLEMDESTWRSLEITATLHDHSRDESLLGILDRCVTSMGSRLLHNWLARPLLQIEPIAARQDAIAELLADNALRRNLRNNLSQMHDLQRLVARVATGRTTPRDLRNISQSLSQIPAIDERLAPLSSELIQETRQQLDDCRDLTTEIDSALIADAPTLTRDGGFIRDGFDEQLDELRGLALGGKKWISQYQTTISQQTGIPSLKVGYNRVFGYYLEVTHVHRDKIPDYFIRKQTLKNAERFITEELKDYEEKVLSANEKAIDLEQALFERLRNYTFDFLGRLKQNAQLLARLDVFGSLAEIASQRHYCRPQLQEQATLRIEAGRHPVLDVIQPSGKFVPNDTALDTQGEFLMLITGPNMAGKSTYIRQVALITLMAQIGSFVPAKSASIGIADRIFARIGASDELSRGLSTFMVEMTETARILNTATPQSLVILDEIGRGTSTYDGVSLAWAIVEYLHDRLAARTLFATHYHELTELERILDGAVNYNVAVKEWEDTIVFLHKIERGAANRSYGIHVAQLAGVPDAVSRRAEGILDRLHSNSEGQVTISAEKPVKQRQPKEIQLTLFDAPPHPLIEKIKRLDTAHVTPLDALTMLHRWKSELEEPDNSQPRDGKNDSRPQHT